MNALVAIYPYKYQGLWVFDDPKAGLIADPIPEFMWRLDWRRADLSGNWYYSPGRGMEGWLCPALPKYFGAPPATIGARFETK